MQLEDDELNPEYPELDYPLDLDVFVASQGEAGFTLLCAEAGMTLAEYQAYMAVRGKTPC